MVLQVRVRFLAPQWLRVVGGTEENEPTRRTPSTVVKLLGREGQAIGCDPRITDGAPRAPKAIVSYDDTPNDYDALTLAQVLCEAGVELILAYVRHATEDKREREQLEEHDAESLLERGARALGHLGAERRVVLSGSTAEGLSWLAQKEHAQIIVFGSDYRTATGHVAPQQSTQALLEGGPAAIAVAPASYRSDRAATFGRIGLLASPGDDAALETALDLAASLRARVAKDEPYVDLLVVGSRPEGPMGRVLISAYAQKVIEGATSPVLVVPRGKAVRFPLAIVGA